MSLRHEFDTLSESVIRDRVLKLREAILDDTFTPPLSDFLFTTGRCYISAARIAEGLLSRGFSDIHTRDGNIHAFITDLSIDPTDPIIVDGTYLQFFSDHADMPLLFVGRLPELASLYRQNSSSFHGRVDSKPTNDVDAFIKATYVDTYSYTPSRCDTHPDISDNGYFPTLKGIFQGLNLIEKSRYKKGGF